MTLSHKICQQLKDAGFRQDCLPHYCDWCKSPQFNDEGLDSCDCCAGLDCNDNKWPTETYIPDLSELIASCEDRLIALTRFVNGKYLPGWSAMYHELCASSPSYVYGPSPEEAVAKLWLIIHTTQSKK